MKIDLSDPFKDLNEAEREFVEYLTTGQKLNDAELRSKFGDALPRLQNNLELRRISAEMKLAKAKRKQLIDNYKLEQMTQVMPLALKHMVDILKNGKEHNRLQAAMFLLKPAQAYLEKHGVNIADLEAVEENGDKFNFTLNVTPLGSKSN